MERRDRLTNIAFLALAVIGWLAVATVLLNRDPLVDPAAGPLGAVVLGLAFGLTAIPIFWLVVFARHGRIAYRGDWTRAIRRGAWVGAIVVLYVALRLQGIFQAPILLFVIAMILVAETTLSIDR
jgi:hypothetical protein